MFLPPQFERHVHADCQRGGFGARPEPRLLVPAKQQWFDGNARAENQSPDSQRTPEFVRGDAQAIDAQFAEVDWQFAHHLNRVGMERDSRSAAGGPKFDQRLQDAGLVSCIGARAQKPCCAATLKPPPSNRPRPCTQPAGRTYSAASKLRWYR